MIRNIIWIKKVIEKWEIRDLWRQIIDRKWIRTLINRLKKSSILKVFSYFVWWNSVKNPSNVYFPSVIFPITSCPSHTFSYATNRRASPFPLFSYSTKSQYPYRLRTVYSLFHHSTSLTISWLNRPWWCSDPWSIGFYSSGGRVH